MCPARASPEAELLELLDRLFDATLDRLLRFKGRRSHQLCASIREDVRQETCARWCELRASGWTPPPRGRERDDFFMRLVGRSNYRVNRPLLPGVLPLGEGQGEGDPFEPMGREDPAEQAMLAESLASLGTLPFAAGRLLAMLVSPAFRKGHDRPNLRRIAKALGCETRTVRLKVHVLLEKLGQSERYTRFWLCRVADALFSLACAEIVVAGDSRLACEPVEWPSANAEKRLERSLGFLSHAALSAEERRALLISRRVLCREAKNIAESCLDAVKGILGPSATLHLWRAEEARAAGSIDRARDELDRAWFRARKTEERRAVWLGRARLSEMEGSYRVGLAALEQPELQQRKDAVVLYDRLVLLTLVGKEREREAAVQELGSLDQVERRRCRSWALADRGPFGLRLVAEPELRRTLLARLA